MDVAAIFDELCRRVDYASDPCLSLDDVASLLVGCRIPDAAGNLPTNEPLAVAAWQPSTGYLVGSTITADPPDGRFWRCATPGTTAATQPEWPDLTGDLVTGRLIDDGSASWQDVGSEWAPTYDLNYGAAEGWRLKASLAAGRYDFTTDGQTFRRAQVLNNCQSMERMYRRRIAHIG